MSRSSFLGVACFWIVSMLWAAPADACICVTTANACDGITSAEVMFDGTVEAIEKEPVPLPDASEPDGRPIMVTKTTVTFREIKAYRGTPAPIVVPMSTDCDIRFVVGKRFLVSAAQFRGQLTTSICYQTHPIEAARPWLDYIASLSESPARHRVWGIVETHSYGPGLVDRLTPVMAVRVSIKGPQRATVITNADGFFLVTGLRAGRYTATAWAANSRAPIESHEFEILDEPHACAVLRFVQ